jgi:hypothetical protein
VLQKGHRPDSENRNGRNTRNIKNWSRQSRITFNSYAALPRFNLIISGISTVPILGIGAMPLSDPQSNFIRKPFI